MDTDPEEKDIKQDMQNSSEELNNNKNSKASKSQKSASQKMQKLSELLNRMQQSMESEQQQEDMEALRALLENLLRLSFDQENLMEDLRTTDINDPKYLEIGKKQRKLKDDAKMIEDSLLALSKRWHRFKALSTRKSESSITIWRSLLMSCRTALCRRPGAVSNT
jgi:hypothetical protein